MDKVQRVGKLRLIGVTGLNGIGGTAGAGKDTFTDFLIARNPGMFIKYSLAAPIKQLAMDTFGFSHDEMYDPVKKEQVNEFWGWTPRRFLQIVGTDMFRKQFRDDVWLKLAELRMQKDPDKVFIMPDIRFPNEVRFIHDLGGIMLRIETDREVGASSSHSSEDELPRDIIDQTISNNGSLEELEQLAHAFYNYTFKE